MQIISIYSICLSAVSAVRSGDRPEACPFPDFSASAERWLFHYVHALSFVIEVENCGVQDVTIPIHAQPCAGAGLAYCGVCIHRFAHLGSDEPATMLWLSGPRCVNFDRADQYVRPAEGQVRHG